MPIPDDPRRSLIMKVARRHFMAGGYDSTGMEAIAREAGVSTATLYLYFPGKADLFGQMINEAAEEFMRPATGLAPVGGPRDQLLTFAVNYARFMCDPFVRAVFRLVIAERHRLDGAVGRFIQKGRTEFGAPLMAILTQFHDAGRLRVPKPSWAAGQLLGMIDHATCLVPLVAGGESTPVRSPEAIAEDAVETFLARYGVDEPQG